MWRIDKFVKAMISMASVPKGYEGHIIGDKDCPACIRTPSSCRHGGVNHNIGVIGMQSYWCDGCGGRDFDDQDD